MSGKPVSEMPHTIPYPLKKLLLVIFMHNFQIRYYFQSVKITKCESLPIVQYRCAGRPLQLPDPIADDATRTCTQPAPKISTRPDAWLTRTITITKYDESMARIVTVGLWESDVPV